MLISCGANHLTLEFSLANFTDKNVTLNPGRGGGIESKTGVCRIRPIPWATCVELNLQDYPIIRALKFPTPVPISHEL